MPFARLTLNTPIANAAALSSSITTLIAKDLGKRHDLTSVLIEATSAGHWTIDATPQNFAAHLEVYVTAGTNTPLEKQTFIQNAAAALRDAMPELALATYIIIKEIPAGDWGYDGHTQAARAKK